MRSTHLQKFRTCHPSGHACGLTQAGNSLPASVPYSLAVVQLLLLAFSSSSSSSSSISTAIDQCPPPSLQAAVDKWVDAAAAIEEAAAAWLPPTGAAATEEVSELSTANPIYDARPHATALQKARSCGPTSCSRCH
jgi:hypothetical protein